MKQPYERLHACDQRLVRVRVTGNVGGWLTTRNAGACCTTMGALATPDAGCPATLAAPLNEGCGTRVGIGERLAASD